MHRVSGRSVHVCCKQCAWCVVQNNDTDRSHTKKMEVISGTVGSGLHRKLILGSGVRIDKSR